MVPGPAGRAERGAIVAGGGLDEYVRDPVLQCGHEEDVEEQTSRHGEVGCVAGHAEDRLFHGLLQAGGDRNLHGLGDGAAGNAEPGEELLREAGDAFHVAAIDARPTGIRHAEDIEEEILQPAVAGGGEPLDLMLFLAGEEPEQARDAAVEVADGIREIAFVVEMEDAAGTGPLGAAAEIASAVEGEDRGGIETGKGVSGSGVGFVVFDQVHLRVRQQPPQFEMKMGVAGRGKGPREGDVLDGAGGGSRDAEAFGDRGERQAATVALPRDFAFLNRGDELSFADECGGAVPR